MPISYLQGCSAYNPEIADLYGYVPSLPTGIIFSIIFGISTFVHFTQCFFTRTWWTSVFAVGALTEVIGWAGRTWSSQCPANLNAFIMQICTLIIGPTFFTAGIYIVLGNLIQITSHHGKTSVLSSKMYLIIFCTCDVISLVVQAVGGAQASRAVAQDPPEDSETGTHIMVAGIVFQMASITVFAGFFIDFLRRVKKLSKTNGEILTKRMRRLIYATGFSGSMIYIRSIYRTVELAEGWSGYLITREGYFIGLDGVLMVLSIVAFNVVHPGWALRSGTGHARELESANSSKSVIDMSPDQAKERV